MRDLRQVKDADEAELLRLAAQAADRTSTRSPRAAWSAGPRPTSAARSGSGSIDEGHDLADFAIVGSGPNGASPHHDASERVIRAGEPVVLDIGGTLAGYASDTTRTIWVAGEAGIEPDPEFRRVYDLVREAQAAGDGGRRARRPGRASRRGRPGGHRGGGLRRVLHPSVGPRHRPRGPRGPVHGRRQRHAARARHGLQRGARHLPARPLGRPAGEHRHVRAAAVARCSTSRAWTCGSFGADAARGPRGRCRCTASGADWRMPSRAPRTPVWR